MDTKNTNTNITKILVGLNLIIYLFILNMDFLKIKTLYKYSTNIKFISIVICFIITLFIGENIYDKKDLSILRLALFFTVLADFNMLILEKFKLGILFFIIVQSLYIIRHGRFKDVNGKVRFKYKDIYLFVFYSFVFIILKRLNLFSKESTLLSMAFIYALLLIHSLIRAYGTFNNNFFEKKTCKIISIGITLFFLCDLNVAFSNISFYLLSIKHVENLENVFLPLIWFFYLPSQILLSLSGEK
ncbi:hypothetical protein [Clostridium botulinum]|uniref:Putative membrane protein n=1 Tax=Clostridium botulinum (strain Langeland / NCTC 10281 / Type F) TaxID=441772 RepID=A7GCL4_CLOBL|nr:hypothetical protein [Clostridium botulinum]ABS42424.1 putative membrane protein [Clostridium botulinum F str. Langeland]ADF98982.1 putative membrane protein [Clostridium botulinum F str. 230613]KKM39740.1 membrane protein [Clostridium botulinum]MBY6792248.1 hypothetical protein [Clostridium botulinum]MBY6936257.1 hypothetical protein [Clostridium botulinum]